ncbi:Hypothetical_protein [Hexamita inflata]|uniref:Hypothetical_protein n=1 Tax=Hexamita inflata TaxID=28002 RepID=A0AA86UIT8_9EUKA|nr:Hypothetical protein HINF_LOCUS47640 [Hexamita inflata]
MSILVNIRKFYVCCISRYLRLVEIHVNFWKSLPGIGSWNSRFRCLVSRFRVGIRYQCVLLPCFCLWALLLAAQFAFRLLLRDNILKSADFLLQTRRRVSFGGSGLLFWQGTWTSPSLIVLQVAICRESKEKRSATHLGPPAFTAWQAYQHSILLICLLKVSFCCLVPTQLPP